MYVHVYEYTYSFVTNAAKDINTEGEPQTCAVNFLITRVRLVRSSEIAISIQPLQWNCSGCERGNAMGELKEFQR